MPSTFRDERIAIIDVGSSEIRSVVGLSESLTPPQYRLEARVSFDSNGKYNAGDDFVSEDELIWPIQKGIVKDWNAFTALMQHVFYKQWRRDFPPSALDSPLGLCLMVSPQWTALDKQLATRIFFEQFFVSGFRIIDSTVMNLFSINTSNGIVVDIGYEKTDIVPILDSQVITAARKTANLGGKHITEHLLELLRKSPPKDQALDNVDSKELSFEFAEQVKCSGICEVLNEHMRTESSNVRRPTDILDDEEDIGKIIALGKTKEYLERKEREKKEEQQTEKKKSNSNLQFNDTIVNGKIVHIGPERFKATDILFQPDFDIVDLIFATITEPSVDEERRCELWDNLVIVGKGSRIKGLKEKIWKTMKARYELKTSIDLPFNPLQIRSQMQGSSNPHLANIAPMPQLLPNIVPAPRELREYFPMWKESEENDARVEESAFLGASISAKMAFSDASGSLWLSKDEYSESGPRELLIIQGS